MSDVPLMRATRAGDEYDAGDADEIVLGSTLSPVSGVSVVGTLQIPEGDFRWAKVKSFRKNWRGMVVSVGLHMGTAAFAAGILVDAPDGSAAAGPQAVEIELISTDAFNALSSTSGASGEESPAKSLEASLPEVSPPATVDLSDVMTPADTQASVVEDTPIESAQTVTAVAPLEPTPPITIPSRSAQDDEIRSVSPPETPPLPTPRPAQREQQKVSPRKETRATRLRSLARGKAGDGADASSRVAAVKGASGQASSVGAGVMDSFRARVMAHLLRHKRYPDAARDRGIRGRVLVSFSFNANGQVTNVALRNASGSALLDAEAVAMVRRASPFPPIPPEAGSVQAAFTAPIVYNMN